MGCVQSKQTQARELVKASYMRVLDGNPYDTYSLAEKKLADEYFRFVIREIQEQERIKRDGVELWILLEMNRLGYLACSYLSQAQLSNLFYLNLDSNKIGDKGCEYLVKGDWKNLVDLRLKNNNITYQGCIFLAKANWNNLQELDMAKNEIGLKGLGILLKRFSECNLSTFVFSYVKRR